MTPKTSRLLSWDGELPEPGDCLRTAAGSTYLVLSVRPNTRPEPKSRAALQLGKLDPDEIAQLPADTRIHSFMWAPRGR